MAFIKQFIRHQGTESNYVPSNTILDSLYFSASLRHICLCKTEINQSPTKDTSLN